MKPLKSKIDLQEIQTKLYEKLKPSGWADKLKTYLLSSDFTDLLSLLLKEAKEGNRFTPVIKQMFRAFEECPYRDLKLVIIGQDPYPTKGVADGIAFSCSNTNKQQPSLRYIQKEIYTKLHIMSTDYPTDLTPWANQGVLLLNTAFTTRIGKVGSHYDIWKPFTTFLFDILATQNSGIVYLFLGAKAKEWANIIPDNVNHKFFVSHPASAVYKKNNVWDTDDTFVEIQNILYDKYGEKINW